ncbi:MAG: metallophosphoesterase family protein [Kiritimatiellae bacterium]|nr:metallophosphoesterase family protein [Kiritimatiellia bacterium]
MLYAIFSDIHANPQAFDKALADAREHGAERFLCLGDVVGYGSDPRGAVKSVRAACGVTLMGNHDAATAGLIDTWNFRMEARVQVARHAKELADDELEWLRELKYVYRAPGNAFAAAHGTLAHPMDFGYISKESEARMAFAELARKGLRLLFVGHTHFSMWCSIDAGGHIVAERADELKLEKGKMYIVNVGSVGYPRNEPHSVYALYDTHLKVVRWRRLAFDFDGYFKRMEAANAFIAPWLRANAEVARRGGG